MKLNYFRFIKSLLNSSVSSLLLASIFNEDNLTYEVFSAAIFIVPCQMTILNPMRIFLFTRNTIIDSSDRHTSEKRSRHRHFSRIAMVTNKEMIFEQTKTDDACVSMCRIKVMVMSARARFTDTVMPFQEQKTRKTILMLDATGSTRFFACMLFRRSH